MAALRKGFEVAEPEYQPYIPEYVELCYILGTACSDVIAGTRTAKRALDDANKKIYDIMKAAGYYK